MAPDDVRFLSRFVFTPLYVLSIAKIVQDKRRINLVVGRESLLPYVVLALLGLGF